MDVEFCRVGDLDGGSPLSPLLPLSSSSSREARGAPVDVVDDVVVEGNHFSVRSVTHTTSKIEINPLQLNFSFVNGSRIP